MVQKDPTRHGEINALLGRGTKYQGKLAFEGRVRIDGHFDGEIFGEDVLIVGEGAEIRASIEVGTLIVRGGEVWGDVTATRLVELHAPGKVHGDVQTPQIFIDKGVVFDGKCTMVDGASSEILPLAAPSVPKPEPKPDPEPDPEPEPEPDPEPDPDPTP